MKKNTEIEAEEREMIMCWDLMRAGDRESFGRIYAFYVDTLYNYGVYFVHDTDIVKDAIQELYIDLWRMRENLSETTSVRFYLFRSLRRKLHVMAGSKVSFIRLSESDTAPGLPDVLSYEEEFMDRETLDGRLTRLNKLLFQLPPRQFEAIRLSYYDNFNLKEVASIMQMNEQSVRNLIQRSIKHLKHLFTAISILILFFFEIF